MKPRTVTIIENRCPYLVVRTVRVPAHVRASTFRAWVRSLWVNLGDVRQWS